VSNAPPRPGTEHSGATFSRMQTSESSLSLGHRRQPEQAGQTSEGSAPAPDRGENEGHACGSHHQPDEIQAVVCLKGRVHAQDRDRKADGGKGYPLGNRTDIHQGVSRFGLVPVG